MSSQLELLAVLEQIRDEARKAVAHIETATSPDNLRNYRDNLRWPSYTAPYAILRLAHNACESVYREQEDQAADFKKAVHP